jgi:hypothetical protein
MNARTTPARRISKENRKMKKLIPLIVGMALTFGAVAMYGNNAGPQKATKATKEKGTKKSKATK